MRKAISFFMVILFVVACRDRTHPPDEDHEVTSVTHWTEKTELFMEYPPLVSGNMSRWALHLTNLKDFTPLGAGNVIVDLVKRGGSVERFSTNKPVRAGIFGVDVLAGDPGTYLLRVRVEASSLEDSHDLGEVTVHGDAGDVEKSVHEERETISFLKEQQWASEFATKEVTERSLRASLRVPAEVRPRTGGEAEVIAPVAGRVSMNSPIPAVGTTVRRGQVLAILVPRTDTSKDRPTLELEIAEATAALELAGKDLVRMERLVAVGAIPLKRLEKARAVEEIARVRLRTTQARLALHDTTRHAEGDDPEDLLFHLRAPLAGLVAESHASAGTTVEEGDRIFRIVAVDTVYVTASVSEADVLRLREITGGELEVRGLEDRLPLGQPVSAGRVIDPDSRTMSVIYEVGNQDGLLAMGQLVSVLLFTSDSITVAAIPESAVIDDAGKPVIFVQLGGESFEKRNVRLGNREGGYVHVVEGVHPGERVVTIGAHLIRLASLSSEIPEHGHAH